MEQMKFAVWLSLIPGLGPLKCRSLLQYFGSLNEVYSAKKEHLLKVHGIGEKIADTIVFQQRKNPDRLVEWLEKNDISFCYENQPQFPEKLKQIYDPPFWLYYKGKLPEQDKPAVAVIGSRKPDYEGISYAKRFGKELAEDGIQVISGLAFGVDIMAHRGTLSVPSGKTFGVLGSGIDYCYPREHQQEYEDMVKQGGIISEYCPQTQPRAGFFPMRNRIISGLSDAVLVIEARKKSGSLITAQLGLEQGKEIMVMPGSCSNPLFEGSNRLLKSGAVLVTTAKDVLDVLGIFYDEDAVEVKRKRILQLEPLERKIYSCLGMEPLHLSVICEISNCSILEGMECLVSLELQNYVKNIGNHYYVIVV